jgi:hypothetical protein
MNAQVYSTFFHQKDAFKTYPALKSITMDVPVRQMPEVNVERLLAEDRERVGLDVPFRFGYGFDVSYTMDDGLWMRSDEVNVWSLKVVSHGAYSLNFIFDRLSLTDGAELYIYSVDGSMVYGPVTSTENLPEEKALAVKELRASSSERQQKESGQLFLTDLVAGSEVVIRLVEPTGVEKASSLRICRVVHGYVNMFPELGIQTRAQSESCNIDIACYPAWQYESNAIAMVLLSSGYESCSGALINTTAQDFRTYFLSAFHCLDTNKDGTASSTEINATQNWAYRFKYMKAACGGNGTSYISYNGSTYKAGWAATDFLLMDLDFSNKIAGSSYTYLGWDRTGSTPSSGTGIHHPSGDVMKISFDHNALSQSFWGGTDNHWLLSYDQGVVEHGSSGSPLFDQNKRIVGQLHGNQLYDNIRHIAINLAPNTVNLTFLGQVAAPTPPV